MIASSLFPKTLEWVRYWCPFPQAVHCGASGAFLTDPREQMFGIENSHLRDSSAILPAIGPLILRGEPGLGKSTELQHIYEQSKQQDGVSLSVDFREVPDYSSFTKIVFESPQWTNWFGGDGRLTLFIDGIDEGIMLIPKFVESLTRDLRETPVSRLRVVLSCRTAEWPVTAQAALLGLWTIPENEVRMFELCPLRRADAVVAAEAYGVDAASFLTAVHRANVEALAARPVTLAFLLREFRKSGDFGKTHRGLYERGCATLCSEHDARRSEVNRRLRKTIPVATHEERLIAAQEIAALTLLSGKANVEVTDETPAQWLAAFETALFHCCPK